MLPKYQTEFHKMLCEFEEEITLNAPTTEEILKLIAGETQPVFIVARDVGSQAKQIAAKIRSINPSSIDLCTIYNIQFSHEFRRYYRQFIARYPAHHPKSCQMMAYIEFILTQTKSLLVIIIPRQAPLYLTDWFCDYDDENYMPGEYTTIELDWVLRLYSSYSERIEFLLSE